MVNIPNIHFKFLTELAMIPSMYLCPTTNPWSNFVTPFLEVVEYS